jgi:hypothetical protein
VDAYERASADHNETRRARARAPFTTSEGSVVAFVAALGGSFPERLEGRALEIDDEEARASAEEKQRQVAACVLPVPEDLA